MTLDFGSDLLHNDLKAARLFHFHLNVLSFELFVLGYCLKVR